MSHMASTAAAPVATHVVPNRRERRILETRRAIVESARTLFAQQGFTETTVDQIAEAADVAPRTFFRYFPNKEMLLFADFDEVRAGMLERLEASPPDEDPLVSLARELRAMAEAVHAEGDGIVWGFRMCKEQGLVGVYERTQLKEQTHDRIAHFVADRLGVDMETDPRPMTWAMAVMAVFGAAMKSRVSATGPTPSPVEAFESLLGSTAQALSRVAQPPA